jgi:CRISPR-associated protein Cas2
MVTQTTMVVTRDVEDRYRGFLTSIMLEVAPGVYVSPRMSHGVRERAWTVLTDWWVSLGRGSLVMVWRDRSAAGHLRIETLGEPLKEIVDADGVLLLKRH